MVNNTKRARYRRWISQGFDALVAGVISLVVVLPLIWMLTSSFKPQNEVFRTPPTFLPEHFSLEGYKLLFTYTHFLVYLRNSFIVATVAALIAITLSVAGVYGVTRFRFVGSQLFTYMVLVVYMFPPILLVIPFYTLWLQLGLSDSLASLSLTYVAITYPFSLWMSRSYFSTIPIEMEEAAMVDGATRLGAFLRITVPQAMPGLVATYIFTFILAWNEYALALVLLSSEKNYTISLGVANLISGMAVYSWPMVNAAGVLATVPVLVLFFFIQRYLVSGLSAGALAGQ